MSFNGNLYESDEGLELTTKAQIHTHDSSSNTALNVGTDGYILSADSTEATGLKYIANTDAGLTMGVAGDIHIRNASANVALAIAGATTGDVLTCDTTLGEKMKWSAIAGGGKVVLLDDHEASGTENSYTYTPSSALNLQDDYAKLFVVWSLHECSATSGIRLNLNGLGVGQNSDGIRFDGTAVTNLSGAGLVGVYLESNVVASVGYSGITEIVHNVSGGGHTQSMRTYSRGSGDLGSFRVGNIWQGNLTGSGNTITSITIDLLVDPAHTWVAGSKIMTYGVEL